MSITHRFSHLGLQSSSSSSSLINGAVTTLADAGPGQVDARLLDYLQIEMVQVLIDAATMRLEKLDEETDRLEAGVDLEPRREAVESAKMRREHKAERLSTQLHERLDALGYRVGWSLAERLSRERPPFPKPNAAASSSSSGMPAYPFEPLDLVKFLCRDVWQSVYQKQIDNLRTNHKGVFVIQDISFPPLRLFSCSFDMDEERERMRLKMLDTLFMPAGIIRGALACFGLLTTVAPELSQGFGGCAFQIKIVKS